MFGVAIRSSIMNSVFSINWVKLQRKGDGSGNWSWQAACLEIRTHQAPSWAWKWVCVQCVYLHRCTVQSQTRWHVILFKQFTQYSAIRAKAHKLNPPSAADYICSFSEIPKAHTKILCNWVLWPFCERKKKYFNPKINLAFSHLPKISYRSVWF